MGRLRIHTHDRDLPDEEVAAHLQDSHGVLAGDLLDDDPVQIHWREHADG